MGAGLALLQGDALSWQQPIQEIRLRRPDDPAEPAPPEGELSASGALEDDAALAEACRRGSLAAYERVYQQHGPRLKSLALNLLDNRTDAEDVVQEVFLKIHRGIQHFKGQSAFSTWIFRILINSCYDLRRKKRRRHETQESNEESSELRDAPAPASNHPLRLALEACIARLSPQQRQVFLLFEVEGFKHSEIAAMLEISEPASKNTLYQAKQNLRRLLTESRKLSG